MKCGWEMGVEVKRVGELLPGEEIFGAKKNVILLKKTPASKVLWPLDSGA